MALTTKRLIYTPLNQIGGMAFLFGGGRPVEADGGVRECERQVKRNVRGAERETLRLDAEEKRLLRELKACGVKRDLEGARGKARELVRLRAHRARMAALKSNMVGLAQELGEIGASQKIQETVGKTALMLSKLNSQLDLASASRLVVAFERESTQMGMKQEVLHDALESAFEAEGEKAMTEEAVEQVLVEAGLEDTLRFGAAHAATGGDGMDEMERRLNALKH